MPLLTVIVVLFCVGVVLYCLQRFAPIDPTIKYIIHAVVVIVTVIWLLQVFGILNAAKKIKVPRVGTVSVTAHR